jgi:Zinc carboxypeptidase
MKTTEEILRFERWQRRIFRLVKKSDGLMRIRQLDYSSPSKKGQRWPIYLLEVGKKSAFKKHAPLLVSGVHGLETIGIRIHLDILSRLIDTKGRHYSPDLIAGKFGLYSIPIMNPAGVAGVTRSNARGIDLNRNSGVEAEGALPFFGGHKLTGALPYFRGHTKERETRALFHFLHEEFLRRRKKVHLALDIHSGYGSQNFFWWPYSFSKKVVFQEQAFLKIAARLRSSHPLYRIEPMALSYQTHGDLWDAALIEFERTQQNKKSLFLPFTLEVGTWQEIRKSPRRLFNREAIFNPPRESRKAYLKAHRALLWDFVHLYAKRAPRREFLRSVRL